MRVNNPQASSLPVTDAQRVDPERVSVLRTPYELWSGKMPNVKNLRVFGCDCFLDVPQVERGKLDARAHRASIIGYAAE